MRSLSGGDLTQFVDAGQIHTYAREALSWANRMELIQGKGKKAFWIPEDWQPERRWPPCSSGSRKKKILA